MRVTSEKDAERTEWNVNPMVQNRTSGCQVFGEIYFRLQFHRVPVHRGRVTRCRVFLVIARHAAHHREVSTRPEIRCLSNRSNGSPRVRGFSGKVDRPTGGLSENCSRRAIVRPRIKRNAPEMNGSSCKYSKHHCIFPYFRSQCKTIRKRVKLIRF